MFRTTVIALTLSFAFVNSAAQAFAPGTKKANKAKSGPFATQVAELRQVRSVLEKANHDYKGHRGAAVNAITKAIHDLTGQKQTKKGAGAKATAKEAQAISDQQLKDAATALGVVQSQLSASTDPHAVKAIVHINKAVSELALALAVPRKK